MNNNDILRRLRYTFRISDTAMTEHFLKGGTEVNLEQITNWLKKDEEAGFIPLYDVQLSAFLNGFIIKNRGEKGSEVPKPEKSLNNNLIFRKLRIALNLKDEDILEILLLADFRFSKSELAALFRNPEHEKFRVCKDQILRNFLMGLQIQKTGRKPGDPPPVSQIPK